ncbi:MAG: hypothetical protein ACREH8_18175 [Opitutaceae bacterium]
MNPGLAPAFYAVVAMAALWLGLLCCARVKPSRRARIVMLVIGVATVCLLVVPLGGLPLWNRAFSIFPNPSLPLLGIVCAALWQRLLGIRIFNASDWSTIWLFGAIAGTALYLHPMMFGTVDLYYWGWERGSAVCIFAVLAVVLLACGSRLGVLLLAALIAYAVNALESRNSWDYIMDPFYWVISMAVIGQRVFARMYRIGRKILANDGIRGGVSQQSSGSNR